MIGLSINKKTKTISGNLIAIPDEMNKLITIKRLCDNSHKHCYEIIQNANNSKELITEEYFNDFIKLISTSYYCSCLSPGYNLKHQEIKNFILTNSKKFKICKLDFIISFMSDTEMHELIEKQIFLDPELIDKLINLEMVHNYNPKTNIINLLISNVPKTKTFEYIIMQMSLFQFSKYLEKINKNFQSQIEIVINKYILKNKINLVQKKNIEIGLKILNTFISKPNIITTIYSVISENICQDKKKEVFNKSILTLDKNLMILLLEKKDIIPDIFTIDKLVEKSYSRPEGAYNSILIAEIIDLLYEYGLIIDKTIIMKLLDHGCYINNLEKHGISVDNEILAKCAHLSYYPYKFDIIPNTDILLKECSKQDNLSTIKKLKEFGGIYTTECLEQACLLQKNGKVIKFLVTECKVKITEKCLENFQEAYKIESLDIILTKYLLQSPIKNSDSNLNKNIDIDSKSTMTITPRNIKINIKDNDIDFILKNKIRKFLEYKKKNYQI